MKAFTVEFKGLIPMTWDYDGEETGPVDRWYMFGECLEDHCTDKMLFPLHSMMPARLERYFLERYFLERYFDIDPRASQDMIRRELVKGIDEFLKLMLEHNEEQHKETNDGP